MVEASNFLILFAPPWGSPRCEASAAQTQQELEALKAEASKAT
jgi:hypothetical protein